MPDFHVVSEYSPSGDQPEAIDALARGLELGFSEQTLLGVTGSGKTFTMAKVIEKAQRPTLVLAHNKTLAAQLCAEFKEFFPENAVEYFVSYYDYYQPEAYIPHTDTFIEKDSSVNDEIERLRHSATAALSERKDVIVVSSVSCIYGLGDPIDYASMVISLRPGQKLERDALLRRLIDIRYERNDVAFERNMFRVRGDTVEIFPTYSHDTAIRIEFFGDEIERISEIHPLTGAVQRYIDHVAVYPASHYGRDALVGIALFLTHLAKSGQTPSQLKKSLPAYYMAKQKVELTPDIDTDAILKKMKEKFSDQQVTDIDGVKIDFPDKWVHLRKSNTEPIIRVYSEAYSPEEAEEIGKQIIDLIRDLA